MLTRTRERLRVRFVVPLAGALAVGGYALAGVLAGSPGDGFGDEPALSPKQAAAAQAFVDHLPTLALARRDETSTACAIPSSYCISDPGRTSRQLIEDLRVFVKANGASVSKVACDESEFALFGCMVDVKLHGKRVIELTTPPPGIAAASRFLPRVSLPGSVAAVVVGAGFPDNAPLTPQYARSLVPTAWASHLECDPPGAELCSTLRATFETGGEPDVAVAAVVPHVEAGGFRLDAAGCATSVTGGQLCQVSGARYRDADGANGVIFIALLSRTPDGATRVVLSVSAQTNLLPAGRD